MYLFNHLSGIYFLLVKVFAKYVCLEYQNVLDQHKSKKKRKQCNTQNAEKIRQENVTYLEIKLYNKLNIDIKDNKF